MTMGAGKQLHFFKLGWNLKSRNNQYVLLLLIEQVFPIF